MKYLLTILLITTGCTSIKRITSTDFVEPPIVSQPDIIEPISASVDMHTPVDLEQTNDVFINLVWLVIIICLLSVLPKIITYLRTKLGLYPSDRDNE